MGNAFIVGAILAVLWFLEKILGTPMVIRPLVVSFCVGVALGDVTNSLLIGATLELVFMGSIQIGGAVPPDVLVGSGLGTAFAIMTNSGPEIALTLALPIAILAQSIKVAIFIVRSQFMSTAVKYAKNAEIQKMKALNIFGLILQCLMYFTVGFVAILFGSGAVQGFVDKIPSVIMSALELSGKLLPAVGFAILLQPMMHKKNVIYFILGFVAFSYLNLPIMAITIFALGVAFVVVFENGNKVQTVKGSSSSDEEWEDLFDE